MNNITTIELVRQTIERILEKVLKGKEVVFIPEMPPDRPLPSGIFHPHPEIFIQLGGYNDITLPWMKFRLEKGNACIIPAYCPHKEKFASTETQFHLLLGSCSNLTMSWHEAYLANEGKHKMKQAVIYNGPDVFRLIRLLDEASATANIKSKFAATQRKGIILLAFAAMLDALNNAGSSVQYEHPKISFCKRLINDHLSSSELCVNFLAKQISCSPNYLSSLFYKETGSKLSDFINNRRLNQVKGLLRNSAMNVSEIAKASGYSDPGYMSRIFSKKFNTSPRSYREKALHFES